MKNSMVNIPAPRANIQRSVFNRSHGRKSTIRQGGLYPFYIDEILPGDTLNAKAHIFMRMLTPIAPLMDNLRYETFFFFVPNRLVWSNFKKFMGEQTNVGDSTSYVTPKVATLVTGANNNTLWDHFGLPTEVGAILTVNALPFRCYNRIMQDWFKDENVEADIVLNTGDGPDVLLDYPIYTRGKRKDYFWQALPYPQKSSTATGMFLSGAYVPVLTDGTAITLRGTTENTERNFNTGTATTTAGLSGFGSTNQNIKFGSNTGLYADLDSSLQPTIENLRSALSVQHFLERDNRGGTRYTELVRAHFGVISPDARLQRAEYLGGGAGTINVHPVAQTSSTDATSPQGNLSAYVTAQGSDHIFKSFTEHGYVIGLIQVTGEYSYQQGIDRMFLRSTKYDYYWPDLAHLGEQAIYNKEIYCDGSANDTLTFGYVPRYDEYRHGISRITGNMRTNATYSYDIWHVGFNYTGLPALNSTYIKDLLPMDRVVAVPEDDHFLLDAWLDIKHARPMPVNGIPGLSRF